MTDPYHWKRRAKRVRVASSKIRPLRACGKMLERRSVLRARCPLKSSVLWILVKKGCRSTAAAQKCAGRRLSRLCLESGTGWCSQQITKILNMRLIPFCEEPLLVLLDIQKISRSFANLYGNNIHTYLVSCLVVLLESSLGCSGLSCRLFE